MATPGSMKASPKSLLLNVLYNMHNRIYNTINFSQEDVFDVVSIQRL